MATSLTRIVKHGGYEKWVFRPKSPYVSESVQDSYCGSLIGIRVIFDDLE